MWSKCPCVASTATGRFPARSRRASTRSGKKPGSMTTASSLPSFARSQQFVAKGLSEKTSRYMRTGNRISGPTRNRVRWGLRGGLLLFDKKRDVHGRGDLQLARVDRHLVAAPGKGGTQG